VASAHRIRLAIRLAIRSGTISAEKMFGMPLRELFPSETPIYAANRPARTISPRAGRRQAPTTREQLEAARHELARLSERQRRSDVEIRALREALEARDTFLGVAGHALRNPMGAIAIGVSNLLFQTRRADDLPPWVQERLEALERHTRHFVRRSTTLLDISLLATGKLRVEREATNLGVVVRDAISELASQAASAQCEVRVAIEDGVVGSWDRASLGQVVHSFLANAITYGAGRPIDVFVRGDREGAAFGVRDRGPGIAAADRERAYCSFEDAIGARERAGFGLGLWVARQLVVAHGGEIFVQSEPGVGSVFAAALPREAPPLHP
jgi:signal transduction histidine kinase